MDCVALQDVRHTHEDDADFIEYNGWYEKLEELGKFNPVLIPIIEMIDYNRDTDTLWEHGLESTFDCVITEDIFLPDEEDPHLNIYNNWCEKLEKIA